MHLIGPWRDRDPVNVSPIGVAAVDHGRPVFTRSLHPQGDVVIAEVHIDVGKIPIVTNNDRIIARCHVDVAEERDVVADGQIGRRLSGKVERVGDRRIVADRDVHFGAAVGSGQLTIQIKTVPKRGVHVRGVAARQGDSTAKRCIVAEGNIGIANRRRSRGASDGRARPKVEDSVRAVVVDRAVDCDIVAGVDCERACVAHAGGVN